MHSRSIQQILSELTLDELQRETQSRFRLVEFFLKILPW